MKRHEAGNPKLPAIYKKISREIKIELRQVESAAALLEDYSVPFIARYRKEATGGLSDRELRSLEERLSYLLKLEERKESVLQAIRKQGKLSAELENLISSAETMVRVEDLYLPFKPKRRTLAAVARENGLEPLAMLLWAKPQTNPEAAAHAFLGESISNPEEALEGAGHILAEKFSEDAELTGALRKMAWNKAWITSSVVKGKETEGAKFSDYFDYEEKLKGIASHRFLALLRGRREGILRLRIFLEEEAGDSFYQGAMDLPESMIADHFDIRPSGKPSDPWLLSVIHQTWKKKILPRIEKDLESAIKEEAEDEAINVFGENLRDLLLAAPAGTRAVMGLDPGYRNGVKVAAVDKTGKLLDTTVIYPHPPRRQWDESLATLAEMAEDYDIEILSIGNGTAARETDRLAGELIKKNPQLQLTKVMVSESGASIYSASEFASEELPEIDVSLRGAVSIARRLQDPLAELIKIEPKSIGVGQYQHDVNQPKLDGKLDSIVEDCVNSVGVDVNTASVPLLARIAGLGPSTASNIVTHRNIYGSFREREQLLEVHGMGPGTFLQSAGFLRIPSGKNPLDASAVHPEAYPVVERIVRATGLGISEIIGNENVLGNLNPQEFTDGVFGEPTVRDIFNELYKPGRDPRPEFRTATFREGIETIEDLVTGMTLEGVVTNVTNFGAFVDVGVHQDGLVHISELDNSFVEDPRSVIKAGEIIKVLVLDADPARKRISLSRKALLPAKATGVTTGGRSPSQTRN